MGVTEYELSTYTSPDIMSAIFYVIEIPALDCWSEVELCGIFIGTWFNDNVPSRLLKFITSASREENAWASAGDSPSYYTSLLMLLIAS